MRHLGIALSLILLATAPLARAQYVFLDANGDGRNDAADQLNPTGTTDVDIWFYTDENRDGSPAVCTTDPSQPLAINSYTIVLRVLNGEIEFGPMRNRLPFSDQPGQFATYEDTTSTTHYHNGWGYRDVFPPGRHLVATLTLRVLDGNPTLAFEGRSSVQPTDLTAFGTPCEGVDFDNTYVLGEEFQDAAGIGPPIAEAGGPYHGLAGQPTQLSGARSFDPDGDPLDFAWTFDDGSVQTGVKVSHVFPAIGTYHVTLVVTSDSGSDDDTAVVEIVEPFRPVANAGGPYRGRPGVAVPFNGSASFDPDGDPLAYSWSFGTGDMASGVYPHYVYRTEGTYAVQLRVSDGISEDLDETTATIAAVANQAPVAVAGGPYEGVVGRWIQFVAVGSGDPDGDFLSYRWEFGDGSFGIGIIAAHAYRAPGDYRVFLDAADGIAVTRAETSASIRPSYRATAFLEGGGSVVPLDDPAEHLVVRFQPTDGDFRSAEVDPDLVTLRVVTTSGIEEIPSEIAAIERDDSDGDGVAEFVALFPMERFRELAGSGAIRGRTELELTGTLYGGGSYLGSMGVTFTHGNRFDLVVTPNPFNPLARVTLLTRTRGSVTAQLYNVHGRRVRTLLNAEPMDAGRHEFVFEARDDAGRVLSSGVYFMQVEGPDGTLTGRVVIAK